MAKSKIYVTKLDDFNRFKKALDAGNPVQVGHLHFMIESINVYTTTNVTGLENKFEAEIYLIEVIRL